MLTALLTLLAGVILTLFIIAANGYFVAQEFAYMSVDRNKLRAQAAAGDRSAARALNVTQRTSFMLSGAQLGITVTGLLVGTVAEPLIGRSLGVLFGGAGVPAAVSIGVGTTLALAVSTVVQMIFGELFPKNYAIANPGPLAKGMAGSTRAYLLVFGWLISVFDVAANALLRLMRVEPVHDMDTRATAEDLEHIVATSRVAGELPEEMYLALDRVLDFPQHDVEHAMIPRSRADSVQPRTTVGEVRTLMADGHTRYPVVDADDQPIGVVHLLDLLTSALPDGSAVTELMREPVIVPTVMPLPEAVKKLESSTSAMACVIDEYGGFAGIVTVEDLAEEIFGEITDEHDDEEPEDLIEISAGSWQAHADVHLDEVERRLGCDLPQGDYETLSGLLLSRAGDLLDVGETVTLEMPPASSDYDEDEVLTRELRVTVLSIDRHVPHRLALSIRSGQSTESEGPR
ncbi:hemolysin family protein [Nesterenkonia sp. NBAIMH1]|uniref:hemolysin family protein n=1 Tax=Nesterenkonia sp. NBAIMH1 TaxID=2600320 RepID=UPI0011B41448|nr:hemolysin family protein [Nesterenkonia sp. NBAIMH1]